MGAPRVSGPESARFRQPAGQNLVLAHPSGGNAKGTGVNRSPCGRWSGPGRLRALGLRRGGF